MTSVLTLTVASRACPVPEPDWRRPRHPCLACARRAPHRLLLSRRGKLLGAACPGSAATGSQPTGPSLPFPSRTPRTRSFSTPTAAPSSPRPSSSSGARSCTRARSWGRMESSVSAPTRRPGSRRLRSPSPSAATGPGPTTHSRSSQVRTVSEHSRSPFAVRLRPESQESLRRRSLPPETEPQNGSDHIGADESSDRRTLRAHTPYRRTAARGSSRSRRAPRAVTALLPHAYWATLADASPEGEDGARLPRARQHDRRPPRSRSARCSTRLPELLDRELERTVLAPGRSADERPEAPGNPVPLGGAESRPTHGSSPACSAGRRRCPCSSGGFPSSSSSSARSPAQNDAARPGTRSSPSRSPAGSTGSPCSATTASRKAS